MRRAATTPRSAQSLGHGFAWLPGYRIREELSSGELKQLPLRGVRENNAPLHLVFADRESAGPGVLRLVEIMREQLTAGCAGHQQAGGAAGG